MMKSAIHGCHGHWPVSVAHHYHRRLASPDWSGRVAAETHLQQALAEAEAHGRAMELQAYRDYHGATLETASPLALALFAHLGIGLDGAAMELGPYGKCPRWLVGDLADRATLARRLRGKVGRHIRDEDDRDRLLFSGAVLRRWNDPRGALGLRLSRHGLEIGACVSGLHVRTLGDVATFTTAAVMPETIKAALPGLRLGGIIDHPMFDDPAYVVSQIVDLEPARSLRPNAWRMLVRVPRVAWRLPWARAADWT